MYFLEKRTVFFLRAGTILQKISTPWKSKTSGRILHLKFAIRNYFADDFSSIAASLNWVVSVKVSTTPSIRFSEVR